MLRGYRLTVIALGLVLAANHAHAKGSNQQPQTEQSISHSLSEIAATNHQEAERAQRADQDETPCGQGKYGSNADLCAQWKAADAATDSARWAWIAAISTIISTAAVLVAIGLTYQANGIARDTAKRELRAYIVPIRLDFSWVMSLTDGNTTGAFRAFVKNSGLSPPRDLKLAAKISFDSSDEDPFSVNNIDGPPCLIGSGDEIGTPIIHIEENDIIDVFKKKKNMFFFCWVFYKDIFGQKRETRFCWQLRFSKTSDSARPDGFTWEYYGPHNCADEECAAARAAFNAAKLKA